jgi:hypothetical protein
MSSCVVRFYRVWVQSRVQKALRWPFIWRGLALLLFALLQIAMAAYLIALVRAGIWTADFMP